MGVRGGGGRVGCADVVGIYDPAAEELCGVCVGWGFIVSCFTFVFSRSGFAAMICVQTCGEGFFWYIC